MSTSGLPSPRGAFVKTVQACNPTVARLVGSALPIRTRSISAVLREREEDRPLRQAAIEGAVRTTRTPVSVCLASGWDVKFTAGFTLVEIGGEGRIAMLLEET
jgi:stage V sporulation protein SpoVS